MKLLKHTLFILLTISIVGCTSKEQINSNPELSNSFDLAEKARKEMYNKEGYLDGKKDGFNEGVNFMKAALADFMSEVRAIQFSSYLIKEKYIQPGAIYIEKDGKITLGQMKIQHPYTLSDIYNRFADKIPVYAKENSYSNKISLTEEANPIEKKVDDVLEQKRKNAFNPSIHHKEPETKVLNSENLKKTFVKVLRTSENEQILNKLGFPYGRMDTYFLVEFNSKGESDIFCNNLNLCVEY